MLRYRFLFEQLVRGEVRQKTEPGVVPELLELAVRDEGLREELRRRGRARRDEWSPERTAEGQLRGGRGARSVIRTLAVEVRFARLRSFTATDIRSRL